MSARLSGCKKKTRIRISFSSLSYSKFTFNHAVIVLCNNLLCCQNENFKILQHVVIPSVVFNVREPIATFVMHRLLDIFIAFFPGIPYVVIRGVTNLYTIIENSIRSIIIHLVLIEY
jgi:hypothetical protein